MTCSGHAGHWKLQELMIYRSILWGKLGTARIAVRKWWSCLHNTFWISNIDIIDNFWINYYPNDLISASWINITDPDNFMLHWNAGCWKKGSFMFVPSGRSGESRPDCRFASCSSIHRISDGHLLERIVAMSLIRKGSVWMDFTIFYGAVFPIINNCLLLFCCWGSRVVVETHREWLWGRGVRFKPVELSTKKGLRGRWHTVTQWGSPMRMNWWQASSTVTPLQVMASILWNPLKMLPWRSLRRFWTNLSTDQFGAPMIWVHELLPGLKSSECVHAGMFQSYPILTPARQKIMNLFGRF